MCVREREWGWVREEKFNVREDRGWRECEGLLKWNRENVRLLLNIVSAIQICLMTQSFLCLWQNVILWLLNCM